ncbi:uncharacterized protein LW94_12557 [Fusarium fujikuroi]|nr:uncharacterized protein LW94_12557 [Fusarium fujikuroi]
MVDFLSKVATVGSPQEVRSYRFFLEVTAPSLAGAFYADFWLTEVPRVCMSDAAIWHAVVSLGSAHEDFTEHGQGSRSMFALEQFNAAIRSLTDSRSPRDSTIKRGSIYKLDAIFSMKFKVSPKNVGQLRERRRSRKRSKTRPGSLPFQYQLLQYSQFWSPLSFS